MLCDTLDSAMYLLTLHHYRPLFAHPQLNPSVNAFSRTFVKDIRRAEEMERKLRMFPPLVQYRKSTKAFLLRIGGGWCGTCSSYYTNTPFVTGYLAQQMEKGGITDNADGLLSFECHLKHAAPSFQEIEELDNKLSQLETEVKEMNDNEANLQRNYLELVELQVCRRDGVCIYILL